MVLSTKMTRRSFAAGVAGVAGAAVLALGGPARAETIELKVSHYLPPSHTIQKELGRWADDLMQKSNGRLKLTIFPAGQMGPLPRQFDLARTGVADISFFLHGALPGRFPVTEVAQLPYVFDRRTDKGLAAMLVSEASAVMTSLADRLAKEHEGTRILFVIASPTVSVYLHKPTVRDPKGLAGMRIRHNGPITSAMVSAWGASPVAMPPSEVADALDKGTLDGMMFNFEAAQAFQLARSLKSVTVLNATAATFGLVMNEQKYRSLPEDLRKLIDDTTGVAAARRIGKVYDDAEAAGRAYVAGAGVDIVDPSPAEADAFRTPTSGIADKVIGAAGGRAAEMKAFRDELVARVAAGAP
jgi:TRAP-type C4-dicarboxylate transport system substrate-binding protein